MEKIYCHSELLTVSIKIKFVIEVPIHTLNKAICSRDGQFNLLFERQHIREPRKVRGTCRGIMFKQERTRASETSFPQGPLLG